MLMKKKMVWRAGQWDVVDVAVRAVVRWTPTRAAPVHARMRTTTCSPCWQQRRSLRTAAAHVQPVDGSERPATRQQRRSLRTAKAHVQPVDGSERPATRQEWRSGWVERVLRELSEPLLLPRAQGAFTDRSRAADEQCVSSSFSTWHLPALATPAAEARREALRAACARAIAGARRHTLLARCTVDAGESERAALAALADGLALGELLPGAGDDAIADVHADVLACVALWARTTGRDRAFVTVTLTRKRRRNMALHLDHVDARVFCSLFGRGTEWVTAPDWLHAAASYADHGRGGAVSDALREAVHRRAMSRGRLQGAGEREAVVIRGTANAGVRRGQPRLHRAPDTDPDVGEWRLVVKIDDGPGWWRDPALRFLSRPPVSRQRKTWGQKVVDILRQRLGVGLYGAN